MRIGRRSRIALLSLVFAVVSLGTAASTVFAAWPVNGDCDFFSQGNYFGGWLAHKGNVTGATMADLYTDPSRFQPCTNPNSEGGAVSQWVSIESAAGGNDIVQIGVIKCNKLSWTQYPDGACSISSRLNKLNFFYAWGTSAASSCSGTGHIPRPVYLGYTDVAAYHNFKVVFDKNAQTIRYYLDNVLQKSQSLGSMCWLNRTDNYHGWLAERWDPNDGFGGVGPVHFSQMRYSTAVGNPVYQNPGIASCAGAYLDPEFACSWYATDHIAIRTVNQ